MNFIESEERNIMKLYEKANIGWWNLDINTGIFHFSTFFTQKIGLKKSSYTIHEFSHLIRTDYQTKFNDDLNLFIESRLDNLEVPLDIDKIEVTGVGASWIIMDVLEHNVSEGVQTSLFGQIRFINIDVNKSIHNDVNELISKQNTLSYSLLAFQKEGSLEDVVNHILNDILMVFRCSRTYVFMYDFQDNSQSCIFELVADGVSQEIEFLQKIPISHSPWIASQVLSGCCVMIDDVAQIEDINERTVLEVQNIKSLIISPMFSNGKVIGYIGVDCVNYYRKWTENDSKWISTLANIISVSYDLYSKTEKAMQKSRKLKQAWETNEDKLKSIVNNVPVGIEIYDSNGNMIDINETEKEIFGISDEADVLGKNIFKNPNLPDNIKEKILSGEWIDVKLRYPFINMSGYYNFDQALKDVVKEILYKGGAIYDSSGNISHYLFISVDNTKTEAAYSQIEDFQRIFTIISDYSKVGFAKYNPVTKKGAAVRQWYKNLEESEDKDLSKIIGSYENMHPDDRDEILEYYKLAVARKIDCFRKEVRIMRPDGSIKYLFVYVVCDVQSDGELEYSVVSFDITDSKNKEAMLIEAKNKAETSDLLKSAFLANMSHEIRTPLNSIIGFSYLLADTYDKEEKAEYVDIIRHNHSKLLALISDILYLSKL